MLAKRALEVNSSSVDAQIFLAAEAADASKHDEGRVIILSRKMLKAVRAETGAAPERSKARRVA